ncbi:MAG: cache domain-containing protein [bacterium]
MKKFNQLTISKKINVIILSMLAIVLLGNMYFVISKFDSFNLSLAEKETTNALASLINNLEMSKNEAVNYARLIASNKEMAVLIKENNRQGILDFLSNMLEGAKLDFVTVTDSAGTVVARSHEPEKFGDAVTKQLNIQEALKGNQISIIEKGTAVKLSARSGAPVRDETGKIVGVVSTGISFQKNGILDNLKKQSIVTLQYFLATKELIQHSFMTAKDLSELN